MEKRFKIKGYNYDGDKLIGQAELSFDSADKMYAMGERWESFNVIVDYYYKDKNNNWQVIVPVY